MADGDNKSNKETTLEGALSKIDTLTASNETLTNDNASLKSSNEDLSKKISALEGENATLKSENETLKSAKKDFDASVAAKAAEIAAESGAGEPVKAGGAEPSTLDDLCEEYAQIKDPKARAEFLAKHGETILKK